MVYEAIDLRCGCRVYIPETDSQVLANRVVLDDFLEVNYITYFLEGQCEKAKCRQCGKEWEV